MENGTTSSDHARRLDDRPTYPFAGPELSALQQRVLVALSEIRPTWTLTGGAALAGFHTRHRETRDLDLFFTTNDTISNPRSSRQDASSKHSDEFPLVEDLDWAVVGDLGRDTKEARLPRSSGS
jgi:hypothetical protein